MIRESAPGRLLGEDAVGDQIKDKERSVTERRRRPLFTSDSRCVGAVNEGQ
jgi:hypothetical protein